MSVSYDLHVKNLEGYEPFYVSADNIPPFDERFLGYGFTRRSQVNTNVNNWLLMLHICFVLDDLHFKYYNFLVLYFYICSSRPLLCRAGSFQC